MKKAPYILIARYLEEDQPTFEVVSRRKLPKCAYAGTTKGTVLQITSSVGRNYSSGPADKASLEQLCAEMNALQADRKSLHSRANGMFRRTWDEIGGDCLDMAPRNVMKRAAVIEVVRDAGYALVNGQDTVAYHTFFAQGEKWQAKAMREFFPFATYGY